MSDENYEAFCECDYDGSVDFYSIKMRKSQKRHLCRECNGAILPGEQYEYAAGKQGGDMWDAKTCARCMALVEYIKAHVPCYCRMHGDLFEDRLQSLVEEARQTPGFAFGVLRRVVAIKRYKRSNTQAKGPASAGPA
jgi:hypothetical protein